VDLPPEVGSPTRPPSSNHDCYAGPAPVEQLNNNKPIGIVQPTAMTPRERLEVARCAIRTDHPWYRFDSRDLARQHLADAIGALNTGNESKSAKSLERALLLVSVDAKEGAFAVERVKLTAIGQRAWAMLWRDLNLRSRP
jgi:hypothetical protein